VDEVGNRLIGSRFLMVKKPRITLPVIIRINNIEKIIISAICTVQ